MTDPIVIDPVEATPPQPDSHPVAPAPPVQQAAPAVALPALSVETALWAALALAALFPRLFDLGRWPLADAEVGQALVAWRFANGLPFEMAGSPLAHNVQALLFALFGASDGVARVGQALAGVGLVMAAWLLRPLLGRGHALATALLLALSPSVLFFSRHASGELFGALCALLLVVGLARWQRWRARRDGLLAAVALGAGLASSAGFWSVLVAGFLMAFWHRAQRTRQTSKVESEDDAGDASARASDDDPPFAGRHLRAFLPAAALAFLIAATGAGVNLAGLGAALALPGQWLAALVGSPPMTLPFLFVLFLYELLALVCAVAGASLLSEARPRWAHFGLLWAALTLLPATLANSGWNGGLLWLALPLALLGGAALAALGRRVALGWRWPVEGATVAATLAFLFFARIVLLRYLGAGAARDQVAWAAMLGIGLVALAVTLFMVTQGREGRAFLESLRLSATTALVVVALSSTWGLSLPRGADPREPLVVQPGERDLRTVAAELHHLSVERTRNPRALPVAVQQSLGAAPLWYLRDFESVSGVAGSRSALPDAALLDDEAPAPPGTIGQRIWLGPTWQWPPLTPAQRLRWLLMRDVVGGLVEEPATLYLTVGGP